MAWNCRVKNHQVKDTFPSGAGFILDFAGRFPILIDLSRHRHNSVINLIESTYSSLSLASGELRGSADTMAMLALLVAAAGFSPFPSVMRCRSRTAALRCADQAPAETAAHHLSGLEAVECHAEQVRLAAAAFGPLHEQAARNWLDRSLSAAGTCTKNLRSALHAHDALMTECVLREDGSFDPRCTEIGAAIEDLQDRLDQRRTLSADADNGFVVPSDARDWVEDVLLADQPSPEALQEQKTMLFGECMLAAGNGPPECEALQTAIARYYALVTSAK